LFQTVPHGVLALFSANRKSEFLSKMELRRKFGKGVLHSVAHNQNNIVNARGVIKSSPGMRNHGTPGDFEKKFVNVRAHASPFSGCNNDGGCHAEKSERLKDGFDKIYFVPPARIV
jgi:hypothetical protein